jgi:uncharacterized protein with GYD domain
MPHYLFRASYTRQGLEGIMKDGAASRIAAVEQMTASVGGRVECAYWAFGEDDFIMIAEADDGGRHRRRDLTPGHLSGARKLTTVS